MSNKNSEENVIDAEIISEEKDGHGIADTAGKLADFFDAVAAPLDSLNIKNEKLKSASKTIRNVARDVVVVRETGSKLIESVQKQVEQSEKVIEKGKVFIDAVKKSVIKVRPRDIPER
jgi:hypothetical protein